MVGIDPAHQISQARSMLDHHRENALPRCYRWAHNRNVPHLSIYPSSYPQYLSLHGYQIGVSIHQRTQALIGIWETIHCQGPTLPISVTFHHLLAVPEAFPVTIPSSNIKALSTAQIPCTTQGFWPRSRMGTWLNSRCDLESTRCNWFIWDLKVGALNQCFPAAAPNLEHARFNWLIALDRHEPSTRLPSAQQPSSFSPPSFLAPRSFPDASEAKGSC